MLREQKDLIAAQFDSALEHLLAQAADLPPDYQAPRATLDRPRQASHGDLACNLALQVAKPLKRNPREIAQSLLDQVMAHRNEALIDSLEIAGPGFINIRVSDHARREVVGRVLQDGASYGVNHDANGQPVVVEFVSANPTGPLHVGHGRQAVLGDCLSALLAANGWQVAREFYYNDAGAQIENLALSVQARARGLSVDDPSFPADGYRGDYIADIASDYLAGASLDGGDQGQVTAKGSADDLQAIREFAVAYLRAEQNADLKAFGIEFDRFYLESSLYEDGRVEKTVEALIASGHAYEADQALWLRSTDFGDDKDRVMRKTDGGYTYFVPDVAYHVTKWERGFTRAINVQGTDHHGTIARVRAGLAALEVGIPKGYPDYVLHKMVTVMRGGEEVKISKRAGSYVSVRDLIEWSGGAGIDHGEPDIVRGRDAVRFFLISRKADTEFVFDIDLALSKSDENPVYYIQYAHARISSVLQQQSAEVDSILQQPVQTSDLALLTAEREYSLMKKLAEWPDVIKSAAIDLAPHALAFYLKDLAGELHSYYNAERFLVDDASLRRSRLTLLLAVRQVLQNGLSLIGVSAPSRM
ncbi:MAG: arginine--tRNA ligase [Burkholderiaceae bacterium]